MNKVFEKLYKAGGKGDIQEWEIRVEGNAIITRWGKVGHTIQESVPDIIKEGKNIGRSNETTPEEQAMAEAQSEWEKKLKKGYVKTMAAAKSGEVSDLVEGGVWTMLAKTFSKDGGKIKWPAYAQPKLDGHRCTALIDGSGKCTLWSRGRKPILSMPHIVAAYESLGLVNAQFDGELYNCDYHAKFEELSHLIRQSKPMPGHEVVEHHCYDMIEAGGFESRLAHRDQILSVTPHPKLVPVETIPVEDEDALMAAFDHFLKIGYEGVMVRNAAGEYLGHPTHRSPDLQKVKEFDDDEFMVIGVSTHGRGKMAGKAMFRCRTKDGAEFDAKLVGNMDALKQYVENPALAEGRMLTVKFQGYTTKSTVPRFPVAMRFRKDI